MGFIDYEPKISPRLSLGSGISFCQLLCWWLATFPSNMHSLKATNAFGIGHNVIQVLTINAWYILAHMPLTDNLPFYHCRLAMLAILFAPRGTYIKQYFALLGVLGSIVALVYPAFDPFPFPILLYST